MRSRLLAFAGILAILSASVGCQSPLDRGPFADWIREDYDRSHLRERLSHRGAAHAEAEREPATRGGVEIPENAAATDYVELALKRNPSIRAAEQRIRRLGQRIPQVTSLDDPMFAVAPIGEMAETAAGQVGLMAGLSQRLPFPGKLETRGRIAEQMVAMAYQDLADTRLNVIADTRRAYWMHYFATQAIGVTEANRKFVQQFRNVAAARSPAVAPTQQDVLVAAVQRSALDNQLRTRRQRQNTAAAMMNSLLDRPVTATLPEPKLVKLDQIAVRLDQLLADAASTNPQIQKVRERIEGYRQQWKLAKLNRLPDLNVGVSYSAVENEGLSAIANGDDQWWLSFGINLPIWSAKLDAGENEAFRGMMEGMADLGNTQNRIAFRVQDAFVKVDTQQRLTILFRDVIVPQAQQTVDASLAGYRAGNLEFLTLIDNWRKLLDFQLMYHRSLAQLEQEFADLQRAVGSDLRRKPDAAPDAQPPKQPQAPPPGAQEQPEN